MSQHTIDLPERLTALLVIASARRGISPAEHIVATLRDVLESHAAEDAEHVFAEVAGGLGDIKDSQWRTKIAVSIPGLDAAAPPLPTDVTLADVVASVADVSASVQRRIDALPPIPPTGPCPVTGAPGPVPVVDRPDPGPTP